MTIYLDLVMVLNFLVDFLLILGTNRLSGFPVEGKRGLLAAMLGAVYSGACLMPGFRFLENAFWRLVSLALMGWVAFGWNSHTLRRTTVFILLSMALGGFATGFGEGNFRSIALSALGVWMLCRLGFGGTVNREYIPLEIRQGDREVRLLALRDTGNTLRDPITGENVLVIGGSAAEALTGLPLKALGNPVETAAQHPGFRLIPYRAVGQPGGMLLMKRFDVKMNGQKGRVLVAFAPETIGNGEMYQALAY